MGSDQANHLRYCENDRILLCFQGLYLQFSYQKWSFKKTAIKCQGQIVIGIKAKGQKIIGSKNGYELREPAIPYGGDLTPENDLLRPQKTYSWDDIV